MNKKNYKINKWKNSGINQNFSHVVVIDIFVIHGCFEV